MLAVPEILIKNQDGVKILKNQVVENFFGLIGEEKACLIRSMRTESKSIHDCSRHIQVKSYKRTEAIIRRAPATLFILGSKGAPQNNETKNTAIIDDGACSITYNIYGSHDGLLCVEWT